MCLAKDSVTRPITLGFASWTYMCDIYASTWGRVLTNANPAILEDSATKWADPLDSN